MEQCAHTHRHPCDMLMSVEMPCALGGGNLEISMGANLNCETTLPFLLRDVKGRKECHINTRKVSQLASS